ncbi:WD40 repeat-like protein [Suillus brevipes Sb2]|nr:WD40 repeat-like protein [Suillus brevipes Sb2]
MALTNSETVHLIAEDLDVSGMEYVPGAGRNNSKNCLTGTREDILSEIKCWIRCTGEDVPRVLWLFGTAGKCKSAIAHTIANWSHERGGMQACFCFDRTRKFERRHEKIFTTIARDLADCDITMRGALACAELFVGPIGEASKAITAPVLLVIDALDESGDMNTREILGLLSGNTMRFPSGYGDMTDMWYIQGITNILQWTRTFAGNSVGWEEGVSVSGSDDKTIRVWDMETCEALGVPLQGHTDAVRCVAISLDVKHIVSGSQGNTIRVWDMQTGDALGAPLQGHTDHVISLAIMSDGNRIVSGSSDQTIRGWHVETSVALGSPLQGHTNLVWSVAISPDGNPIVSGSIDKTIWVWDANTITGKASISALTASVNSVALSQDGHCIVSSWARR